MRAGHGTGRPGSRTDHMLGLLLVVAGVTVGALGWGLLPRDGGRLQYAIEIADPRPLSHSGMSQGLKALGAVAAVAITLPPREGGPATSTGQRGQAVRALLVPHLSTLLTSADEELGRVSREAETRSNHRGTVLPRAAAGGATGAGLGLLRLDGVSVQVVALLRRLGPIFDSSLLIEDAPASREAFHSPGAIASARYLLLTDSWERRERVLARLRREPGLLPAPSAGISSPARPPALRSSGRIGLAAALICAGALVMGLQLRGISRAEMTRRFRRG